MSECTRSEELRSCDGDSNAGQCLHLVRRTGEPPSSPLLVVAPHHPSSLSHVTFSSIFLPKTRMGQTLSEPVTQKETSRCENSWLRVGASCMQGWRVNMEDAHTTILSLPDDPGTAFFAVYDGHGGSRIALHAGKHLHKSILKQPEYKAGNIEAAIKQGFLDLDNLMQTDEVLKDELAGTTAICCLLRNGVVYCGNVGDSRAIASVGGRVEELSNDHKPSLASEQRRITAAGGWVELNRVNGNLALSRALGDFVFKKNELKSPEEQIVTACPDVITRDISEDWEFILLACDGIWDVMTNQEVVNFVRLRLSQGMEPEDVCEDLMTRCLAPDCQMGGLGCDNMTVVLICLVHSGSWREEMLIIRGRLLAEGTVVFEPSGSSSDSSDEERMCTPNFNSAGIEDE